MKTRILAAAALACAVMTAEAREKVITEEARPRAKAGSCKLPSPHYEVIHGKCTPSCGVLLGGHAGRMAARGLERA